MNMYMWVTRVSSLIATYRSLSTACSWRPHSAITLGARGQSEDLSPSVPLQSQSVLSSTAEVTGRGSRRRQKKR